MKTDTHRSAVQFIKKLAARGAYARFPNPIRRKKDGQAYKKGYEIRLPIRSGKDMREAKIALRKLGFSFGKPFKKHSHYILPIFGREQVGRFLELFRIAPERSRIRRKARMKGTL